MSEKKGVGLNPLGYAHYTDHLAVVCVIMGIPLIFTDADQCELAQKYYPKLHPQYVPWEEFDREALVADYDVLFSSEFFGKGLFDTYFGSFEKKYHKRIRHVHCPHGFSDKGFWLERCVYEDITLVYGQNMLDLFKERGVLEDLHSYVITGNYRYTYYKQHKSFFDKLVDELVLSRFPKKQTTVLYAPTWKDAEETSSFFEAGPPLFDYLPDHYNMIAKLHPNLLERDPTKTYQLIARYEEKPNVIFLESFPLVYPLLACSDIYIGDTSSIGYDYLVFDKPMFLLNQRKRNSKKDRSLYLFRCGTEILPNQYANIYSILEKNLPLDHDKFSKIRTKTYHYTFGEEKTFEEIKTGIQRIADLRGRQIAD